MTLAGIQDVGQRHFARAQRCRDERLLIRRHDGILRALKDDERRLEPIEMIQRRTFIVDRRLSGDLDLH
jgi:hypothetical protein